MFELFSDEHRRVLHLAVPLLYVTTDITRESSGNSRITFRAGP